MMMYVTQFFIVVTILSTLSVLAKEYNGKAEEKCSPLCSCKREENSSKVKVAQCMVTSHDSILQCSVEWPVLFLTVKLFQFDSSLLIRCQRIKRLLISPESALSVLKSDMFQYSTNLEILIVKAPILTLESVLLRHLSSLRQLDISETNVASISRSIFEECPISDIMRLVQNQITFIEDYSFRRCIYLVKLDLNGNRIQKINLFTFEGAFNLEVLDLSKNKIDTIDDLSFKHLKKLKMLSLNGNMLHSIKQETFSNLETLTHLRLDGNKITYVATEAFKGLKSIQVINLKDNKISRLHSMLFLHLTQLKLSFPDVDCVQEREEDSDNVSLDILREFNKYPLCDGLRRTAIKQGNAMGNQKLIQPFSSVQKDNSASTEKSKEKDSIFAILEAHPYVISMVLGGLVVTLVSVIVISVVCHVKNKRINELRLQELQLPMMQSTL